MTASRSRPMRAWLLSIIFVLASLTLLYWDYPFDGMVINESWGLHFNEVREFKFFGYGDAREISGSKPFLYDPATQRFDWSFLHARRGLVPIVYWLLDHLSVGNRVVFTNVVSLTILGVNLLLFSYIVWRLAGPASLFPIVALYGLYPFSAGIHFWQVILVNNLALTFFFLSLGLFLSMDYFVSHLARNLLFFAIPSLACFWLSLFNHEYALFLSPLYLYLALYYSHGRTTLWRFTQWRSPYVFVGLAFVLTSVVAFLFLIRDAPSILVYGTRFRELAALLHFPAWLVTALTTLINSMLFYLSALFSNTVGLLLFPLGMVWENRTMFQAAPIVVLSLGLTSALVAGGVALSAREARGSSEGGDETREQRLLLVVGVAWAVLSYLPFSTSFGYPRTIGLMADRVNILAACGVAIVFGTLLLTVARRLSQASVVARTIFYAVLFVVVGVLFLNLYAQREYFVEVYHKERNVARIVLAAGEELRREGRTPIVLIDRATKVVFPRAEMMAALEEPQIDKRAWKILAFLFERYFRQEALSTSFNLNGIFLFGCCPETAYQTFNGYAALWTRETVPVYKREEPFRLYEDGEAWRVGYEDTRAWSTSFGTERLTTYPKRTYQVLILELGEPFFTLRGPVVYAWRPYAAANPKQGKV